LARVLEVVVDALRYEDEVREAEVDCKRRNGGNEIRPDGAGKVGDVPDEPYGEEGQGDALCRALLVVLNQLRDLEVSVRVTNRSRVRRLMQCREQKSNEPAWVPSIMEFPSVVRNTARSIIMD